MGLLNLFSKSRPAAIRHLPQGSLTVDRNAHIVATTIPSSFAPTLLRDLARHVLHLFQEARKAQMPDRKSVV